MSSNQSIVELQDVWKKYSRAAIFHRSLREDIANIFSPRQDSELHQGEFWALQGISLTINSGEIVGLYGPNGAGKSTILKLIAEVTYPTKGSVQVKAGVAPLLEFGGGFHPDLSGAENILINGVLLGMSLNEAKAKTKDIAGFAAIEEFIEMPVKNYSTGMYLRLAFSIAVHSEADIFLIDEVVSVGDEDFQAKCLEKIRELKTAGKTILFVTHNKTLLEKLADRTYCLQKGKLAVDS
jgi:ABC-type polysaccharide/polyol phosphate transport system ATPase subunit